MFAAVEFIKIREDGLQLIPFIILNSYSRIYFLSNIMKGKSGIEPVFLRGSYLQLCNFLDCLCPIPWYTIHSNKSEID